MGKKTIGIIGGGNMGEAIIIGSRKSFNIKVCEISIKRQRYLKRAYKIRCENIRRLTELSNVIVIAVKPQDIDEVLCELSKSIKKGTLVISVAAGIMTNYIERKINRRPRVVRTMPNMPALIGQGITAVCKGRYATRGDTRLACNILKGLGKTVIVKEKMIDSITAVSGSGPAYVYLFMECLMKAAKKLGLKESLSEELIKSTFLGSVNLLISKNLNLSHLRAKVTSKGGTTQAATDVFMRRKIDKIIEQALKAAQKRAKVLARR